MIAKAIIDASKSLIAESKKIPLMVIRLSGTNSELGLKAIETSGLNVITAVDLDDAAKKIVNAVK
jgi:succinyl-CoA synthetase beta subunit